MSRRKTHEEFVDEMKVKNPDIKIIGKYQRDNANIECQCKFGHVWEATPSNLLRGRGCPYCSGHKTLSGKNDIATTHPNFIKYFKNKQDAITYSYGSHKKVVVICPDCGYEFNTEIKNMISKGFKCKRCSDNVSYPNKFSRAFIEQLPVKNIKYEYQPIWGKPYIYDNYFEFKGKKYILEMDGEFHFKETKFKTLEKNIETDKIKTELAIKNGIYLIRIDCQKSEKEYIKKNIVESELSNIFDLNNIDWYYCDSFATSNFTKRVCDYFNSLDIKDVQYVINKFGMCRNTILRYLKKGNKLGWCNYDPSESAKIKMRHDPRTSRKIIVRNKNNDIVHIFYGLTNCYKEMSKLYNEPFNKNAISQICRGLGKTYKGFKFEYAS